MVPDRVPVDALHGYFEASKHGERETMPSLESASHEKNGLMREPIYQQLNSFFAP